MLCRRCASRGLPYAPPALALGLLVADRVFVFPAIPRPRSKTTTPAVPRAGLMMVPEGMSSEEITERLRQEHRRTQGWECGWDPTLGRANGEALQALRRLFDGRRKQFSWTPLDRSKAGQQRLECRRCDRVAGIGAPELYERVEAALRAGELELVL